MIAERKSIDTKMIDDLQINSEQLKKRQALSERTVQDEKELAHFFAVSLDLLCVAGLDGYFKRLNPAWTELLGWSTEELKAKPFLDFVHLGDRVATQFEVGKLAEGRATVLFENRYLHKDGSYRWLQWNATSVPGVQLIYATARDITRQRRLEKEVIEILDREKERLGRELHDGLCQTLAGIAALSATLSKRLTANSESAGAAAAAEITKLLGGCIGEARDLARGLSPLGLAEGGLDEALAALALNFEHMFRVPCSITCDRPFPRLQREAAAHLFRIAQEALNNAVAHGRAERIEISLNSKHGEGILIIRDDGMGVPDRTTNPDGIGMHTMAYRARLIGASLTVRRRVQRGTAVICTFPVSTPNYSSNNEDSGAQELLKETHN
jgi:PAS domain S-box-containing protein